MALTGRLRGTPVERQRQLGVRVAETERRLERLAQGGAFRRGVVAAIGTTTITVIIDGQPLEMGRMAWYAPTAGDPVVVAVSVDGWFALGKLA